MPLYAFEIIIFCNDGDHIRCCYCCCCCCCYPFIFRVPHVSFSWNLLSFGAAECFGEMVRIISTTANRSARAMYDEIVWYIYTLQWYIYTHTQNCSEYLLFAAFPTQQVTHLHNLQWIYRDILSRCNTSSKLSVLTSWAKKAKKELLFFGTQVNFCLKYGLERG